MKSILTLENYFIISEIHLNAKKKFMQKFNR